MTRPEQVQYWTIASGALGIVWLAALGIFF